MMRSCSLSRGLQIVAGGIDDYKKLACYHYRDSSLGPFAAIFALKATDRLAGRLGGEPVGVIVYRMPGPALELRTVATGGFFTGFDRGTALPLINKNIRCIARVIIEPRFRGLGLASRLVRETMPTMNCPIVEALAVMGLVNPFFEKAGMTAYVAKTPARCVRMVEAFSTVAIEQRELIDPQCVRQKLARLDKAQAGFIEREIKAFLQSYGRRRDMLPGLERTRYVLSKLTFRPVYYIWFNPNLEMEI
ncbi:MAG: hypothetical protein KAY65_05575 [Planctomycetes bacterium]|nr:hypothetical protein [Planctomycetota bacterium]